MTIFDFLTEPKITDKRKDADHAIEILLNHCYFQ